MNADEDGLFLAAKHLRHLRIHSLVAGTLSLAMIAVGPDLRFFDAELGSRWGQTFDSSVPNWGIEGVPPSSLPRPDTNDRANCGWVRPSIRRCRISDSKA
jgi:hypothetical protein